MSRNVEIKARDATFINLVLSDVDGNITEYFLN